MFPTGRSTVALEANTMYSIEFLQRLETNGGTAYDLQYYMEYSGTINNFKMIVGQGNTTQYTTSQIGIIYDVNNWRSVGSQTASSWGMRWGRGYIWTGNAGNFRPYFRWSSDMGTNYATDNSNWMRITKLPIGGSIGPWS
jgi:hypothetical protein